MRQQKYFNRLSQVRDSLNTKRYNRDQPPITQAMLAKYCNVTRQTIIAIEKYEQMPSYPLAITLWAILQKQLLKFDKDAKLSIQHLFPIPSLTRVADKSA